MKESEFYLDKGYAKIDHNYNVENRFLKISKIIKKYRVNSVGLDRNIRILDVGCGEAGYLKHIRDSFSGNFDLYGIDLNTPKTPCDDIIFIETDVSKTIDKIQEYTDFFDIIVAGEVIEHIENTDFFIKSLMKISSDKGIIVVTTPNLASWIDRVMLLVGWQPFSTEVSYESRLFGREGFYNLFGVNSSAAAGHLRCFTRKAMISFLKYHDCNILNDYAYYQQPYL
jgi:2-polyprenyl-3-methyl-5-hydroxy-6-metoxy-1,4-benzoquinol methylase